MRQVVVQILFLCGYLSLIVEDLSSKRMAGMIFCPSICYLSHRYVTVLMEVRHRLFHLNNV